VSTNVPLDMNDMFCESGPRCSRVISVKPCLQKPCWIPYFLILAGKLKCTTLYMYFQDWACIIKNTRYAFI